MAQPEGPSPIRGIPQLGGCDPRDRGQYRQEKEQAAELGVERVRAQVESPDINDLGGGRPRTWWTFVIDLAWQASESFILEDLSDGDRTEAVALVGQTPLIS